MMRARNAEGTAAADPAGTGLAAETVRRFSVLADAYDRYRPAPPSDLIAFVGSMAPASAVSRVVDLGCGTGLSTRPWAGRCDEVVGLDPSSTMLDVARAACSDRSVVFTQGWAHDTGLPDGYASIVTCGSSFHWMEPEATVREVGRILRPGGVLAVYGPQIPPVAEGGYAVAAWCEELLQLVKELDSNPSHTGTPHAVKWANICRLIRASSRATYCNEFCFHDKVSWTADEFCTWLLTISSIHHHLATGHPAVAARFRQLQDNASRMLGTGTHTFVWCYRLILCIYE